MPDTFGFFYNLSGEKKGLLLQQFNSYSHVK